MNWSKLSGARSLLLTLAGLLCVSAGVFLIYVPAGLIVAGLALVLLAYLTDPSETPGGRR